MNQMTLTDMEYSNRKKKTKREEFLGAMDEIIPWSYWVEIIRPYYFNNKRGRKPIGIETMLRMYLMHGGTVVDASLIAAPKSTKNKTGRRDPEMHQTKRGNEWYSGMKVHAGDDAGSGYVHSLTGTSANMHDVSETSKSKNRWDMQKLYIVESKRI